MGTQVRPTRDMVEGGDHARWITGTGVVSSLREEPRTVGLTADVDFYGSGYGPRDTWWTWIVYLWYAVS